MHQGRAELVEAARRGDREAMGLLIQEELPWVRGVVAGYLGADDSVDDLCQDIFVSAWQSIDSLRKVAGFRAWLYRIAVNRVRSHIRGVRRNPVKSLTEDVPSDYSREVKDREDRQEAVRVALEKLAPEYRDPLVIHYLQGKSCAETAAALGLRPVTARIRLLRGRRQLAALLKTEVGGGDTAE